MTMSALTKTGERRRWGGSLVGLGLALGARAAAKNDWWPWKWEVDGHGGGIYYGGEVRWG